ncbi:MAG: lipopolysaccharide biosynthesis protein [Acidimicrobiales bacterium]
MQSTASPAPPARSSAGDLRRVLPIVGAGAAAGLSSLITTVLVARLLTSRGYGAFIVLLGLFLVLSMPGSALLVAVVRRITTWESEGRGERIHGWVVRVHRVGTVAVVVLALAIWLVRAPLISLLSLPGPGGVVEILTAAGIWVLVSIDRGLLQARQDYRNLSVNLVLEAVTRTAFTIGLAAAWGVTGAAFGVLIGELVTAVHARVTAMAALARRPAGPGADSVTAGVPAGVALDAGDLGTGDLDAGDLDAGDLEEPDAARFDLHRVGSGGPASAHTGRHLAADMAAALIGLGLLAVLQNADVIGLGSQAPHRSGSYAAISVPAKALVYGALVFVNYLLPESAIRWHQGSHALRQLAHTLLILALPAAALLAVAAAVPRTLLDVVFGAKLAAAAPAFATLVLAMICLCVTVVLTVYLLGVGWRWIVVLLAAGTGALIVFTLRAHGQYLATARTDLVIQALLALSATAALVAVHRRAGRHWLPAEGDAEGGAAPADEVRPAR